MTGVRIAFKRYLMIIKYLRGQAKKNRGLLPGRIKHALTLVKLLQSSGDMV